MAKAAPILALISGSGALLGLLKGAQGEELEPFAGLFARLEDYQFESVIGRGGFATVFRFRQLSLGRHLAIDFQHRRADVDDRHLRPRRGVQSTLTSTAGRQTQHPAAANVAAQPTEPVDGRQGIDEFLVIRRLGETLPVADHRVPCALVMLMCRAVIGIGHREAFFLRACGDVPQS